MNTTLFIMGCAIFVILGIGHAALMLFTAKFEPKDALLLQQLKTSSTQMNARGGMWKGITGFHLSHSLGMVVFGGFYMLLALENVAYLRSSSALKIGLFLVAATYIALAQKYWFSVPRNCFSIATGLLAASFYVS